MLVGAPAGRAQESDFELRDAPDTAPGDGEVLVRNVFVSVDPYMRGRMTGVRTYVGPFEIGEPDRRRRRRARGRVAPRGVRRGRLGALEARLVRAGRRRRRPTAEARSALAPPSTALGVLGMPGFTAWVGLVDIGQIKEGETIYVSGAAGAVGSAAAQIAKLKGLRVIGSAGSAEKVDGCGRSASRRSTTRDPAEGALADGIDVFFDNVGGAQLEAALNALRPFGRVIACGAISRYNDEGRSPARATSASSSRSGCACRASSSRTTRDRFPPFLARSGRGWPRGKLLYRETSRGDRERAGGVRGLFRGDNIGKMLVRVGPDG